MDQLHGRFARFLLEQVTLILFYLPPPGPRFPPKLLTIADNVNDEVTVGLLNVPLKYSPLNALASATEDTFTSL